MDHVVPVRVYLMVFAILLALTATTTAVAYVDLGRLSAIVMLTIAVTKATLVVLYFMHVRYSSRLTWLVIGSALGWLALLIAGTTTDMIVRGPGLLR
jgi:cytochrome c oxidase subunit 4